MKKLYLMLLTMLFCVVSAYGQDSGVDKTSTSTNELVTYTMLEGSTGISNANADYLFDGDSTTKWCPYFTKKQEGETVNGAFVIFKTSFPLVPRHYTMTTADDTQQYSSRNWKQWQIYGMNAGSDEEVTRESENWVPLDKKYNIGQDQLPATNYTSVEFSLSEGNTTPYMYFKIEIDDIFGSTYCMQMADFLLDGITGAIPFADANVKAICVSNWDTDGDGELSMEEVAMVTTLGEVFKNNNSITSFKELQLFTGLTTINDDAFDGCSSLTSVILPKSVSSIGNHAFNNCSNLTSIALPKSLTSIGNHAFDGCSSLTAVTLPENLTFIADYAFNGCVGLTSVTIPESVTSIGNNAFEGCSGLTSVYIPDSVTEIGDDAFKNCSSITTVDVKNPTPVAIAQNTFSNRTNAILVVPSGSKAEYFAADYWKEFKDIISMDDVISFADANVKSICVSNWDTDADGELSYEEAAAITSLESAFRENTTITSFEELQYFKGLKIIGEQAFYNCASLSSVNIPNSVTTIGEWAFGCCSSLTSVILGSQLKTLDKLAFRDCTNLSYIIIPNSVTSIGECAFQGCSGLTSVTIGNGVSSLKGGTFSGCSSLNTIQIPNSITYIEDASNVWSSRPGSSASGNFGVFHGCESLTSITIPDGVTHIGSYAFIDCSSLTSINIPGGVTAIGESAFNGCNKLTSITLGDNLESIGDYAFAGCTNISSIIIPNSVTSIGARAFQECSNLTSVELGSQLITIGDYAFYGCSSLSCIIIPNSVTSIGKFAFLYCTGLTSITIGNSLTSLQAGTFCGCTGLTTITIPNSVISIEDAANSYFINSRNGYGGSISNGNYGVFSGCSGLTSITIGRGVTHIGSHAFRDCENLTSVKMGKNVIYFGEGAFKDCRSLLSITLPNTLECIGDNALSGCTSLTSITIPNSVTTIGTSAFMECSGLTSVTIGSGVAILETGTFQGCNSLTNITIPNSITSIGDGYNYYTIRDGRLVHHVSGAFYGCSALTSVIIGSGVTHIGSYTFLDCSNLTSIKLPECLTSMGDGVFSDCPLKSIELPNAFTIIPENLFQNNTSIQYVKLGNNVKSIGKNAFGSRELLLEIGTSTPPTIASDAFPNVEYLSDINVIVPNAAAETAYRKAAVWQEMTFANQNNIAEVNVETPGDLSFELITQCNIMPAKVVGMKVNGTINADDFTQMLVNMKSLLRLDLSDCNITAVPDDALNGKTQLQELTLPTGLQTIGKNAFRNCPYLTGELSLPSTLTSVGESAFVGTTYTSVKLPSTLKTIGNYAFNNVPIKQKLSLPNRVTSVGAHAFEGTQITELVIYDGMKSIGDYAFAGTPIQGHVTIPDGVTYLGRGAFSNTQISTVFLPNSITTLSQGLFQGCPNLNTVYVPDNYTALSSYVFEGCGALTILRLSANLTSMEEYSLQNIPLEYIKVPSQVEVLSHGVLKNCKNLTSLSLPANLKSVEDEALYGCTALRNLSVEAIDPPTIKDRSAIRGINTDLCLISIPTQSYRKYVLAEYWGQFVQMRNDIAVETSGNGEIAFEGVDEEGTDDEEEVQPDGTDVTENEFEEDSKTHVSSGSSIYVPQEGKVRFYIMPAEGEKLVSATLDGEDITPYIEENVYVATADKKNAKLIVNFSDAGQGGTILPGDVNDDGEVSVTDVGCVINYILEQIPEPFIYAAADMNGDDEISVTDVGYIINYILNDGASYSRAIRRATYSYGAPTLTADNNGYVLAMDGADAFIGFQMDVIVPGDAKGCNVQLKKTETGHQLACRRLSNGHYRMVCYSPVNETFSEGITDLLTIASEGDMAVRNIRFTTESLDEVRFADISATPTGIVNVVTDQKATDVEVYTLDGQLYRVVHARPGENPLKDLEPGIYLINKRKFIVR